VSFFLLFDFLFLFVVVIHGNGPESLDDIVGT